MQIKPVVFELETNYLVLVRGRVSQPSIKGTKYFRKMCCRRKNPAATVCNGKIIVCGGVDERILNSVECFDPNSEKWTRLMDMPKPLSCPSLVCFKNKLVVMGQYYEIEKNERLILAFQMDSLDENGVWEELRPPYFAGALYTAVALGEEIFAIDGKYQESPTDTDYVEVQIFDGKKWRAGPSLPHKCCFPTAITIPQNAYVFRYARPNALSLLKK